MKAHLYGLGRILPPSSFLAFALLAGSSVPALAQSNAAARPPAPAIAAQPESFRAAVGTAPTAAVRLAPLEQAEIDAMKHANASAKVLQVGIGRATAIRLDHAGDIAWQRTAAGFAAHWEISSPGARALRIALAASGVPATAQIRFAGWNSIDTVYGPFSAVELLSSDAPYWSPVLEGETAVMELYVAGSEPPARSGIDIVALSHLIASPLDPDALAKTGESGACEVDLVCRSPSNAGLVDTGNAVARMTFSDGSGASFLCTGTLLNPIGASFRPYFYTANHCIGTQSSASTLTTHWFFDRTGCGSGGTSSRYVQLGGGATLLHANAASDASFMCLNRTPPDGAMWAGWDANPAATGLAATAIHHPRGDWKKVSLGATAGFSAYPGDSSGGSYIVVTWNSLATGVTEGGSSGSGIFTLGTSSTDFRLRGGLRGGPSSCTATGTALRDYYSRLDAAYPAISQYLSPTDSTCNFTLAAGSVSVGGGASSYTVVVSGNTCCPWVAVSNVSWITTSSFGAGPGTATYAVAANPGSSPRTGTITIGGQPFTVTQGAAVGGGGGGGTGSNLVLNPGFEGGGGSWTQSASGGAPIIYTDGAAAHSGTGYAWLGGYDDGTDTLTQDVSIPADSQSAYLQFWYRIATSESATTTTAYDTMTVSVVDLSSGAATTLATFSNRNASSAYVQSAQYDLSSYRGRRIRLRFAAVTDFSNPSSFYVDDVSVTTTGSGTTPPATPSTGNYSDIWYNPSESGWGLTIADHETQLFAVWYTYRIDGRPTWFAVSGGTFTQNRRIFTGDLYQTTGPGYNASFNPSLVNATRVGTVTLDFAPPGVAAGHALFTYTVNGVTRTKEIQRQAFGNSAPEWGRDYTDIWWNSGESGWGLTLAQHGNNIFGVWFTYDTDGQPLFVVMPGVTFNGTTSFTGALYTTTGPYYGNAVFDPSQVRATQVGTATINFSGRNASFNRTINGSNQQRPIAQQPFGNAAPTLGSSTLSFNAATPTAGVRGQAYGGFCFCQPAPTNVNDLCGFPTQGNPSGGSPPYHFQLDTAGGFPPIGMSLTLNGCLTGTPSASATGSTFSVCAVDLGGNSVCRPVSMVVNAPNTPPPASGVTGSWSGTWSRHFGGFGDGSFSLRWNLTQTGSSVTGTYSWTETACDGTCPDPVGFSSSGSFASGSVSNSTLSLITTGGTTFTGTINGNTITGTQGGSFPGTFTMTRQ